MTTILVDDEKSSRQILRQILAKYCPQINMVGEAENVEQAFDLIESCKPELVFLDIEMPGEKGITLIERYKEVPFHIIFTTAYKQYALEAIKQEAVDYLLKPLSIREVIAAVDKAEKRGNKKNMDLDELKSIFSYLQTEKLNNPQLALPTSNGYEFFPKNQIIRCEAKESYTIIYFSDQAKKLIAKRIGDIEKSLPQFDFFRIHNSFLVNRNYIKNYVRGEGGSVIMQDNTELPVSRRKKAEFIQWLVHSKE